MSFFVDPLVSDDWAKQGIRIDKAEYTGRGRNNIISITVKNKKYLLLQSIAILQRNGQVATTKASVAGFL